MKKLRENYDVETAKRLYLAHESGLSYNDIVRNPNYNTKQLSMQRLQQIVSAFKRKLDAGDIVLE